MFLLCYLAYDKPDHIAGVLAGVFAVGVALFPVTPDDAAAGASRLTGYVHLACAVLFFGTLTYFSLCLFTKTHEDKPPTRKKLQRNKVYKACGYTMAICIVLIIIHYIVRSRMGSLLEEFHPVFWLESVAVVAFGISWFIKGEAMLKDVG